MAFRFVYICDLLEELGNVFSRYPPYLPKDAEQKSREVISHWFKKHRQKIRCEADGLVLLSTLLPEKRTDKVYELREKSLERIIARSLSLSTSRYTDLVRWREPGAGDLADCLERVQRQTEVAVQSLANEVTIEEIEEVLLTIAGKSRFSSPEVRSLALKSTKDDGVTDLLGPLYQRLQGREAKWLTRLILKNYEPIIISDSFIYRLYHPFLPGLLKVQAELRPALKILKTLDYDPSKGGPPVDDIDVLSAVRPAIGTKIGRQPFFKARSIKHCVEMAQNRRMSVEKKYDGEYCQIHIDMSQAPQQQIKIFSKSGKDSTQDRVKVHHVIRKCFKLDEEQRGFSRKCALEGELLVYNDKDHKIMDFHKIRKHVSRSGSFLGTEKGSQAHDFEHLMVVFFDILILDEEPVLNMKHYQRMHLLHKVMQRIPGRAELGERQVIAFAQRQAAEELRKAFARSISMRGEGLVMKPSDEPYFNFNKNSSSFQSCCIKLKKEYIGQFGDVGDFTVIGASYDAVKAKSYQTPNLQWTDFYIGCLENREGIIRYGEKPRFVVVAIVSPTSRELMKTLAGRGIRTQSPLENSFDLRIEQGIANGRCPPILFSEPFVFDIRCFAFDKEGNTGFWTMRFPQVSKLHLDRSFMDTVSFEQLQAMAEKSRSDPYNISSQEELEWVRRLEISDTHGIAVDASTQQSDALSITTASITQDSETQASHSQTSSNFANVPKTTNETVDAKLPVLNNFFTTPICRTIPRKRMSNIELDSNPVLKRRDLGNLGVSAVQNRSSPRKIMIGLHGPESDPENWSQPLSEIINMADGNSLSRQCYRRPSSNSGYSDHQGTTRKASLPISIGSSLYSSVTNITHQDAHVADGQIDVLNISTTTDTRTLGYNNVVVLEKLKQPCQITGLSCIFYQYSIALTPCVVNIPWLTENLLPVHDILSAASYNALAMQNDCDRKARRRMLLAERHRVKETEEAIQYIRELDTKRPSGSKAWIDIYDWHLLEHVKRLGKCGITEDILRRYWIGTV